jgi:hypothetical protein
MVGHHPRGDASWTQVHGGVFELGDDFYDGAGGILDPSPHFEAMVSPPGAGR